ncbi:DUF3482 domain-containing protein [Candidatus Pacearchaeota archaeon]|nr:MAG: DUF3482 domain-containing protein [Candidatus Pacearchaeota archaeon]
MHSVWSGIVVNDKSIQNERIYIAVAGHTNVGKTTLIRTLMRSPVGEVGDRANVTQKSQVYSYESLLAYLVDTPGLRFAGVYNLYLDAVLENPGFSLPPGWQEKVEFEREAVRAIRDSNVVLYVGSLQVVPDDSHKEEIRLIKRLQPQMVGILNFSYSVEKSKLERRVTQWRRVFFELGIDHVLTFDTHWDRFSKVNRIYEEIAEVLSSHERRIFLLGLRKFKERQEQIHLEAAKLLADSIKRLQNIRFEYKKSNSAESRARTRLRKKYEEITLAFVSKAKDLYDIAAEYPTESLKSIKGRLKTLPNWKTRLRTGGAGVTVLGGGGAAIGAAIGALIAGVLSGGVGAGGGALFGLQIGGAIGGGIGALFALDDEEDKLVATFTEKEIFETFQLYVAIMWGVAITSYGRNPSLPKEEVKNLLQRVQEICNQECSGVKWKEVSKETLLQITRNVWEKLENE